MKTRMFGKQCLAAIGIAVLGLSTLSTGVLAQPVVTYTTSGTPGNYILDFTINNTTPGTQGFDIYDFGVLVDGVISSSPVGYSASSFSEIHTVEITGPASNWPFNNAWIDPSDALLPTGVNLAGFEVSDTDQTAPTSVQYYAIGYNPSLIYTGPGNENMSDPANPPLFVGEAAAVPEPATLSFLTGLSLLGLGRATFLNKRLR